MVVLEVGIDARGVVQGSQQASSALSNLSGGVGRVTTMLADAGSQAATFGMILTRWSPLLSGLAAAFSGITLAVSAFSTWTKSSTKAVDDFAKSMSKLRGELEAARLLGMPQAGILQGMAGAQVALLASGQPQSLADLRGNIGVGQTDLVRFLARQGHAGAIAALREGFDETGRYVTGTTPSRTTVQGGNPVYIPGRTTYGNVGDFIFTPEQLRQLIPSTYAKAQTAAGVAGAPYWMTPGTFGPQLPYSLPESVTAEASPYAGAGPFLPGTSGDAMARAGASRWRGDQAARAAEEAARAAAEHMRDLVQLSAEVGANLGDGIFDFVAGLRSGRDIVGQLLMDLGRGFSRTAMQQLTQGIITSFG